MIHVLLNKKQQSTHVAKVLTDAEIQQLVVAFKAFTLSSGYRAALQVLIISS